MAVTTRASAVTSRRLKEVYGKYMNLLNYGAEWIKLIKFDGADMSGRELVVPIRTTKIIPGQFMNETDPLPTPVNATLDFLRFDIIMFAARLGTTWMAQEFDSGMVVPLSDDLTEWIKSNNEALEYAALFGGRVRGLISEKPAAFLSDQAETDNAGGAMFKSLPQAVDYDGDYGIFKVDGASGGKSATSVDALKRYNGIITAAVDPATKGTWVPVQLRCLDDYALVASGNGITLAGAADTTFVVSNFDELLGTVSITAVSLVNTPQIDLQAACAAGSAIGLELRTDTGVDLSAAPAYTRNIGNVNLWTGAASKEMQGVLSNLFFGEFGQRDRSTASFQSLRSLALTMATTAGGGRTTLTAGRVVDLLARITVDSGDRPSELFVNDLFEAIYVTELISSIVLNDFGEGGQKKYDKVPKVSTLAGYQLKSLRRLPRGILFFTNTKDWAILTPKKGGGLGGVPMLKFRNSSSGRDSDVTATTVTTIYGFWNQYCKRPRASGMLCGINIVEWLAN